MKTMDLARLTDDERALMSHISMWGSDGYPVQKIASRWHWREWRSIRGSPIVYRTKHEAVAAFEAYMAMLRERYAEERYEAAIAERA